MSSTPRPKESQLRHAFNIAKGKAAIEAKQATLWDKSGLQPYREKIGAEREAGDKRKIESIFNMAVKVPALKEALDWANAHGIDFIIDRNMAAWGMYHPGTGILSVSEKLFEQDRKEILVEALTHEIRHAWQDWNGLLPAPSTSFTGLYIGQALIEADAYAYGFQAKHQYNMSRGATAKSDPWILREGFDHWFSSSMASSYGVRTLAAFGRSSNKPFVPRDKFENTVAERSAVIPEFRHPRKHPFPKGISPDDDSLAKLGRGFTGGGSYFNRKMRDKIIRKVFATSAAMVFFKQESKPHEMANDLRKREMKDQRRKRILEKLQQRPRKLPG